MDDHDLVVVVAESDHISVESPLWDVREESEEGVEYGSRADQEVAEPSGQRLGGSVILDEGLGIYIGDEGGDGGSLGFSQHGDLSLSNFLDPLGGLKETSRCWDDKGWIVSIILHVPLRWGVKGFLVVINLVLQPEDAAVEAIFFKLVLFFVLLDGGCQAPSNIGGERVVRVLNEVKSGKCSAGRERAQDPVGVVEHIHHSRWFRDGEW